MEILPLFGKVFFLSDVLCSIEEPEFRSSDFRSWLLAIAESQVFRRSSNLIQGTAKIQQKMTFDNCQKSTAKVTSAKFGLPAESTGGQ